MNLIFSSACRSMRGGTQTTHGILIRRLDFSVDRLEVQPFHFFWCFQNPFTIAAEIKKL